MNLYRWIILYRKMCCLQGTPDYDFQVTGSGEDWITIAEGKGDHFGAMHWCLEIMEWDYSDNLIWFHEDGHRHYQLPRRLEGKG